MASRNRRSTVDGLMRSGDQQERSGSRVAIGNQDDSAGFKDDAMPDGWRRDAQHVGRLAAEFIRQFQRRLILVKHRPKPL